MAWMTEWKKTKRKRIIAKAEAKWAGGETKTTGNKLPGRFRFSFLRFLRIKPLLPAGVLFLFSFFLRRHTKRRVVRPQTANVVISVLFVAMF